MGLAETVPVAIHCQDVNGKILWANHAALELVGYGRDEYLGRKAAEFHVDPAVAAEMLRRLKNGEELCVVESKIRRKDGSIRNVSIHSNVYRENGQFMHARCVTMDADSSLSVSSRLAAIVESSDDAIISNDLNGYIQTWNPAAERIFGYKPEEIVGRHISTLAAPERLDEIPTILARIARGDRIDHYETKRKTRDGRILTVFLTISPLRDDSGVIIGASKVARDVTEQKKAEEVREQLAAIVESSDDAIISKSLEGVIRSWNRGAQRLFGYTAEEMIGKHVSVLAVPERVDEIPAILSKLARGERVEHYETRRKTKDGRILTVSLSVSPIRDASGTVIGAAKVARDISDRKRHEQEIQEANTVLRRANEDLKQFAYSASHDLQEPLRMVATYSALASREYGSLLGPEGKQYLDYALEGALRMERLLQDLRAYTLVSTSDQQPPGYIDPVSTLNKVLLFLDAQIRESGARIDIGKLPDVLLHEFQLEQLFQNLIGNAIRYRSTATPLISVSAVEHDGQWIFSVIDNGIGIDPQYKEHIFEIFKRLHSVSEYPGTGMGLAICKRIVERAGGRIWVESQPGRGATFSFTLPAKSE